MQYPSLETQRKYLGPIHAWVKWRKSNRQVIRRQLVQRFLREY
jgi:hypothetical protein